jgi:hypothetical protein
LDRRFELLMRDLRVVSPVVEISTDLAEGGGGGALSDVGESERLVVEPPWSQLTSECQRF